MKNFKIIKLLGIFLFSFILIQFNAKPAFADAAGSLTSFSIPGYSFPLWIQQYGNNCFRLLSSTFETFRVNIYL